MPYTVRDLTPLKTATSSGGAAVTNAIGHLDDASSITLYFQTTAIGATPAGVIQVSQFDPADAFPQVGVSQSSGWTTLTSVTSSASAQTVANISFRGLRVSFTATSSSNGEVLAFASKQISV